MTFASSEGLPFRFRVEVETGEGGLLHQLRVSGCEAKGGVSCLVTANDHDSWLDFFASLAAQFGTRMPFNRRPAAVYANTAPYAALLTENLGQAPSSFPSAVWLYTTSKITSSPASWMRATISL